METTDTPLLIIIFNRPDKVRALISALAVSKPRHLFIAADGPRIGVPSDSIQCAAARSALSEIDWDCEITTRFSETNFGCRYGITNAVDWFFEHVEAGIILEDDCIPHPTFFSFCSELLEYYKNDTAMMHISGNNFQNGIVRGDGSYYFSMYSHSWGWATWRRAWQHYQAAVAKFPVFDKNNIIANVPLSKTAQRFWIKNLRQTIRGKDSWDSLWQYTIWQYGGLAIIPNKNLVSNIGFDNEATHTSDVTIVANLPVEQLTTITHPMSRKLAREADEYTFQTVFYSPFSSRLKRKLCAIFKA